MAPTFRIAAIVLLVIGAALMLASVFADSLGVSGGGEGVGWKQLIAAIAGLIILLLGLAWLIRPDEKRSARNPDQIARQR